ncbi:MAG: phage tail sheath subtilisin-like domain-containing protein [Chloroflexota bacterium]
MAEYLSPGVYVEEVNTGPRPIEGVGTSVACFVGFTEKAQLTRTIDGETVTEDIVNKPQYITNWTQYAERFGGLVQGAYLPHAVYGFFQNGGARCYIVSVKTIPSAQAGLLGSDGKPHLIVQAREAGFDGLKYRVKVENNGSGASSSAPAAGGGGAAGGDGAASTAASTSASSNGSSPVFNMTVERQGISGGWTPQEVLRDVTLTEVETEAGTKEVRVVFRNNRPSRFVDLIIPEDGASLTQISPRTQEQSLNIQKRLIEPATYSDFQGEVLARTGVEGLAQYDDINILVVPDLMNTMPGQKLDLTMVKAVQTMLINHCEAMGDRVVILDSPPDMNPMDIREWRQDTAGYDTSYAALYYPWIEVMDPSTNRPMNLPPSGHIAGVWARSDSTRGVHKAPANEIIRGALNFTMNITKGEQDILNPIGVNCLRAFPGLGYRIWGARTLSSDPLWRYINVRRLFNFIESSIERGTMWAVFEPNDTRLWARVQRDINNFLSVVYSSGALFGDSPSQAFFVKCDAELNTAESIDLGRLVAEIGIAPVKPAEFIIFRISQWSAAGGE